MPDQKTSDQILKIAQELVADGGLGAVSFDAIAGRLGRSKQAVLYWFPTKQDLLGAMFLPWLEAEAGVAVAAIDGGRDRNDAIDRFVRAVAGFHLGDLDRFRMMYLVPQTTPRSAGMRESGFVEQVHPITDQIYGALAAYLEGTPGEERREAVAIHSAVLGMVLMFALADGLDDPLKHDAEGLVDALISVLRKS